ncbi:MAG TPA: nitroreductase family protein [Acidimicrobiales bacterium]|nr:nitroreductase family protein [Acidimicrobiales bacterium]
MELRHAMRTTPATREFADADVSDEVLYRILDDARFAPNGGNRQAWKVIVVRDRAVRQEIGRLYDLGMREYMAHLRAGLVPFAAADAHRRTEPAVDLDEARRTPLPAPQSHLAEAPVLLVVLLDLANCSAVDTGLDRLSITAGASVYPFAHNILLAARSHGLGGHFTSVLTRQEPALRRLLGIPEGFAVATVLPIGKPVREVTRLRRAPVEEFTAVGSFDGPRFAPASAVAS